jgi:hypothetical protein
VSGRHRGGVANGVERVVSVPVALPPASAGPGEETWHVGRCWLYCRRDEVLVTWLGPVTAPGMSAPLFGCGDCVSELSQMLWTTVRERDAANLRRLTAS